MTRIPKHFYTLALEQLYDFSQPNSILDVGCGSGWTLRQLQKRWPQASTLGVDKDYKRIQAARFQALQERLDVNFQIGKLETLHLASFDSQYDLIVCHNVLAHLKNPHNQLTKLKSWLKPGGTLSLLIENPAGKWIEEYYRENGLACKDAIHASFDLELDELVKNAGDLLNKQVQKKTDQRVLYPLEEVRVWLEKIGFNSIRVYGVSVLSDYILDSEMENKTLLEMEASLATHSQYHRLAYFYHFLAVNE